MRSIAPALCFLTAAFTLVGNAVGAKPAKPRATIELQIANQVSGSVLEKGSFDLILKNQSTYPLWVNGRMGIASPGHPRALEDADVLLEIVGPSGAVPYECFDKEVPRSAANYVLLAPGQKLVRTDGWFCFVRLEAPGHYTAQARYRDRDRHPPPAPVGSQHLTEEITSLSVQFEVR